MPKDVKSAALRFLKIRPRSVAELRQKLEGKGFSSDEIEPALQSFTDSGLLDDRAFTKSWISYRLARPFGFRRIIRELKTKGIDQELIDEAVAEAGGNVSMEAAALDLGQRRWRHLPSGLDPQKKRKRVLDFLLRRGFEPELALKVLKKLSQS